MQASEGAVRIFDARGTTQAGSHSLPDGRGSSTGQCDRVRGVRSFGGDVRGRPRRCAERGRRWVDSRQIRPTSTRGWATRVLPQPSDSMLHRACRYRRRGRALAPTDPAEPPRHASRVRPGSGHRGRGRPHPKTPPHGLPAYRNRRTMPSSDAPPGWLPQRAKNAARPCIAVMPPSRPATAARASVRAAASAGFDSRGGGYHRILAGT